MMPTVRRLLAFAALLFLVVPATSSAQRGRAPWGTGQSQPEDIEVSLVTFSPGPSVESWFGHTALVVEDKRLGQRRLYNYGMFNFGPDMLPKFAMGRLEFWVADTSAVTGTYRFYAEENRDVRVQTLNLTPAQNAELAKALDENVLPQNRTYLYHHYLDNCATRPRDIIDRAVGGQLLAQSKAPARMTLREHTRRHSAVAAPMSLLLDFLMNDEIDQPIARWDEAFLPAELESMLAQATVTTPDGKTAPLVANQSVWFKSTRAPTPSTPPAYGPWLLLIGALIGGAAVGLAVWYRRSGTRLARVLLGLHHMMVGLVFGLPGTVLLLMWLITEHTVTHRNENLLLANPLTLLALPLGFMLMLGSSRAARGLQWVWTALAATGVLALLIKVLPIFDQDNWRLLALLLPISLGTAFASVLYGAHHAERTRREDPGPPRAPRSATGASLTSNASVRG